MQPPSDSSQVVHPHHEYRGHSSLTRRYPPYIPWLDNHRDHHFHTGSSPLRPSLSFHPRSLHLVPGDLQPVSVSSNRISLHSSMCLQWLSVTRLIRWPRRPDLLSHHIDHYLMHPKVRLPLHWPLARGNPQDPFLDLRGRHLHHCSSPVPSPLHWQTLDFTIQYVSESVHPFAPSHFYEKNRTDRPCLVTPPLFQRSDIDSENLK